MSYKILGITGPAHCGKDTLADFVIAQRPKYVKASFADPLKQMLAMGLGLVDEQLWGDEKEKEDDRYGCTPRHMMQTLGTEWGRQLINGDIWTIAMNAYLENREQFGENYFIIPDVRFENEAAFVREHGCLIHITGRDLGVGAGHASEHGVDQRAGDYRIDNSDLVETFYDYINAMLSATGA